MYIGSRNPKSRIFQRMNPIIQSLKEEGHDVEVVTPQEKLVKVCIGCTSCFKTGKCVLDLDVEPRDHMIELKRTMLQSDIIVFVSPTYAHNVSGDMKNIIDRLSYWLHLIPLAGKNGIAISFSDTNGAIKVSNYLEMMMNYMGINVVLAEPVTLIPPGGELEVMRRMDNIGESLRLLTEENIEIQINEKLESYFKLQKTMYKQVKERTMESVYWNEILKDVNTIQEYIEFKDKLNYQYY